jgi:hypothetical protein
LKQNKSITTLSDRIRDLKSNASRSGGNWIEGEDKWDGLLKQSMSMNRHI